MAEEEVGLRITLKDRKAAAQGLTEVKGGLEQVGDAAQDAGKKADHAAGAWSKVKTVGASLGKAALYGAAGIVSLGAAVGGVALKKGFDRLNSIDQATAKLTGLGHSAGQVTKIMANSLKAVRGTAFGLDEAATVSASSVAAGIKPGRELTKTLKLVADAATIGGTSMSDMGAIFNKVATSNKIQGDVINQLNDKGIPIVQLLGKSMHKTAAEVMAMSAKGQIGFAQFSKAMQAGVGGAAKKYGDTFTGSWKNLMASLSRIGAGLMSGIFPHLAPGIQGITAALAPLEKKSAKIGAAIGRTLGPALEKLGPTLARVTRGIAGFDWSKLDLLSKLKLGAAAAGGSKLGQAFAKLKDALAGVDWSKVTGALGSTAADGISVTAVVVGFLADHLGLLAKIMPAIIIGFTAMKLAQAAESVVTAASIPLKITQAIVNQRMTSAMRSRTAQMEIANGAQVENTAVTEAGTAAESSGILTRIRAGAVTAATTVKTIAMNAATKAAAAGQWLLNAAMTDNPIGLVVLALAALVGGMVIAYKKSETFRTIVNGAFHGIADAAQWMWSKVLKPTFKFIIDAFLSLAGTIVHAAAGAFGWIPGIGGKLKGAAKEFDKFRDSVNASLNGVKDKTINLTVRTRSVGPGAGTAPANKMASDVQATASGKLPKGATGGIIRRRPGGLDLTAGEGRWDEALVPMDGKRYLLDATGVTRLPDRPSAEPMAPQVTAPVAPMVAPLPAPKVPAVVMPDPELVGAGDRAARPIRVALEVERKVLAEAVLDGFDDKGARQ